MCKRCRRVFPFTKKWFGTATTLCRSCQKDDRQFRSHEAAERLKRKHVLSIAHKLDKGMGNSAKTKLATDLAQSLDELMRATGGAKGFADTFHKLMVMSQGTDVKPASTEDKNRILKLLNLQFQMMKDQAKHEVAVDLKNMSTEELQLEIQKQLLDHFPPDHPVWLQFQPQEKIFDAPRQLATGGATGGGGAVHAADVGGDGEGRETLRDAEGVSGPEDRVIAALRALEDP
jgi:hypothetical protein